MTHPAAFPHKHLKTWAISCVTCGWLRPQRLDQCVSSTMAGFHLSWVEPGFNYWFACYISACSWNPAVNFLAVFPNCLSAYLFPLLPPPPPLCLLASFLWVTSLKMRLWFYNSKTWLYFFPLSVLNEAMKVWQHWPPCCWSAGLKLSSQYLYFVLAIYVWT